MGCASSSPVIDGDVDDHMSTRAVRRGFASEEEANRNAEAQRAFHDRESQLDDAMALRRLEELLRERSRAQSPQCESMLPPAHTGTFPEIVVHEDLDGWRARGEADAAARAKLVAPTPTAFDLLESEGTEESEEGHGNVATAPKKESPIIIANMPGQPVAEDDTPSTDTAAWIPIRRKSRDSIIARELARGNVDCGSDSERDAHRTPPSFLCASDHVQSASPSTSIADPKAVQSALGSPQPKLHRLPLFTLPPRRAAKNAAQQRRRSPSFLKLADG